MEQQLSASETSRAALREQFDQLSQEVDGYRKTIQQHVSLAASAKVRDVDRHITVSVVEIYVC